MENTKEVAYKFWLDLRDKNKNITFQEIMVEYGKVLLDSANKPPVKKDKWGIIITDDGTHGCHLCFYFKSCKVSDEPCKTCVARNGLNAYYVQE